MCRNPDLFSLLDAVRISTSVLSVSPTPLSPCSDSQAIREMMKAHGQEQVNFEDIRVRATSEEWPPVA